MAAATRPPRRPWTVDQMAQISQENTAAARRPVRVLTLAASLRRGSINHRLVELVGRLCEADGAEVDHAELTAFDCPSFDGDVEEAFGFPPGAREMRLRLDSCDAVAIASPEYNASLPGAMKNVIDWVSRFRPQPFKDKHALLVSASPSVVGGNRGLWALRIPLEHLAMRVYPDMFSLSTAGTAFRDDGALHDEVLAARLADTVRGFLDLAEAAAHYPCAKARWYEFPGEHAGEPGVDRVQV